MLPILYEDNYLLAVDKPAGLQAEADRWGNPSAQDLVADYLKQKYPWKKQLLAGLVHRLDRPVSGVLLFAITPLALKRMNATFEARGVRKFYTALVEGRPDNDAGELAHWLRKDNALKRAVQAPAQAKDAALCRLRYRVLREEKAGRSLLEVELLTGRYHQIRAQLALVGCPVVCDDKYGTPLEKSPSDPMIHLHSARLLFEHPMAAGTHLVIEAPAPKGGLWPA